MGSPQVGGDPATIADCATTLTTTATTSDTNATALANSAAPDSGHAALNAALARYIAAASAVHAGVATDLNAVTLLARTSAQDLATTDGQPVYS